MPQVPIDIEDKSDIINSMKLVIPLHWLYWSIHTKDESKRGTAFAFIFGVNWLWRLGVTASCGVFFYEMNVMEIYGWEYMSRPKKNSLTYFIIEDKFI